MARPRKMGRPLTDEQRRLVESHLGLARTVARGFRGLGLSPEDLEQEGVFGLAEAARRFDPGRGVKFSTLASHWIREAIWRAIHAEADPVRLPSHAYKLAGRARRLSRQIEAGTGRRPTVEELADGLGLDPNERRTLRLAMMASRRTSALSDVAPPISADDPAEQAEQADDLRALLGALPGLPEGEAAALRLIDGEGRSVSEAARRLGTSQWFARRDRRRGLARLREAVAR